MFIVVSLVAVFVMISIYLYFRAESLQSELTLSKREAQKVKKENGFLIDAMIISANKNEEFAKFRLQEMKNNMDEKLAETLKEELEYITLLTANYGTIYKECLKGNVQLKTVTKNCLDNYTAGTFNCFTLFITNQDSALKKMWLSNNLQGFISLVEALLLQLNKKIKT
ncbi:hypothetical protein [Thalassotalea agariperforans]